MILVDIFNKLPLNKKWISIVACSFIIVFLGARYVTIQEKNIQITELKKSWKSEAEVWRSQVETLRQDTKELNKELKKCNEAHRAQAEDVNKIVKKLMLRSIDIK